MAQREITFILNVKKGKDYQNFKDFSSKLDGIATKISGIKTALSELNSFRPNIDKYNQIADAISKLADAAAKMKGLRTTNIGNVAKQLEKFKTLKKGDVDKIKALVDELSRLSGVAGAENIAAISQSMTNIAKAIASVQNVIGSIVQLVTALKELQQIKLSQVGADLKAVSEGILKLLGDVSGVKGQFETVKTGLKGFATAIQQAFAVTPVTNFQQALVNLTQNIGMMAGQFLQLGTAVTGTATKTDAVTAAATAAAGAVNTLNAAKERAFRPGTVDQYVAKLDTINQKLITAEAQYILLNQEVEKMRAKGGMVDEASVTRLGKMADKIADLTNKGNVLRDTLNKAFSKVGAAQQSNISGVVADFDDLNATVGALPEKINATNQQLIQNGQVTKTAGTFAQKLAAGFDNILVSQLKFLAAGFTIYRAIGAIASTFRSFLEVLDRTAKAFAVSRSNIYGVQERYELLGDTIVDTSAKMGRSIQDVSEILFQFGSAGLEAEESIAALDSTMRLIIATDADVTLTTKTVAATYRLLGETIEGASTQTEKFARINDIIAATYRDNQVEINEMTQALKFAVPVAKQLNLSFEETSGIIATLQNNMIRAGEAGRSLRAIFSRIASQSADFAKAFDIDIDTRKPLDFLDIIEQIGGKLQNNQLTADQVGTVFTRLGLRGANSFLILTQNVDDVREAIRKLQEESQGAAKSMSDIRLETAAGQIKIFQETVLKLARDAFEPLFLAIGKVAEFINILTDRLKGTIPGQFLAIIAKAVVLFVSYRLAVVALGAAMQILMTITGAQTAAQLANVVAGEKAVKVFVFLAGKIKLAAIAMRDWTVVTKASTAATALAATKVGAFAKKAAAFIGTIGIWAAALAAVGAIIWGVYQAFQKSTDEILKELEAINKEIDQNNKRIKSYQEVIDKINGVQKAINDSRATQEQLNNVISESVEKYNDLAFAAELSGGSAEGFKREVEKEIQLLKDLNEQAEKSKRLQFEGALAGLTVEAHKASTELYSFRDELDEAYETYQDRLRQIQEVAKLNNTVDVEGANKKALQAYKDDINEIRNSYNEERKALGAVIEKVNEFKNTNAELSKEFSDQFRLIAEIGKRFFFLGDRVAIAADAFQIINENAKNFTTIPFAEKVKELGDEIQRGFKGFQDFSLFSYDLIIDDAEVEAVKRGVERTIEEIQAIYETKMNEAATVSQLEENFKGILKIDVQEFEDNIAEITGVWNNALIQTLRPLDVSREVYDAIEVSQENLLQYAMDLAYIQENKNKSLERESKEWNDLNDAAARVANFGNKILDNAEAQIDDAKKLAQVQTAIVGLLGDEEKALLFTNEVRKRALLTNMQIAFVNEQFQKIVERESQIRIDTLRNDERRLQILAAQRSRLEQNVIKAEEEWRAQAAIAENSEKTKAALEEHRRAYEALVEATKEYTAAQLQQIENQKKIGLEIAANANQIRSTVVFGGSALDQAGAAILYAEEQLRITYEYWDSLDKTSAEYNENLREQNVNLAQIAVKLARIKKDEEERKSELNLKKQNLEYNTIIKNSDKLATIENKITANRLDQEELAIKEKELLSTIGEYGRTRNDIQGDLNDLERESVKLQQENIQLLDERIRLAAKRKQEEIDILLTVETINKELRDGLGILSYLDDIEYRRLRTSYRLLKIQQDLNKIHELRKGKEQYSNEQIAEYVKNVTEVGQILKDDVVERYNEIIDQQSKLEKSQDRINSAVEKQLGIYQKMSDELTGPIQDIFTKQYEARPFTTLLYASEKLNMSFTKLKDLGPEKVFELLKKGWSEGTISLDGLNGELALAAAKFQELGEEQRRIYEIQDKISKVKFKQALIEFNAAIADPTRLEDAEKAFDALLKNYERFDTVTGQLDFEETVSNTKILEDVGNRLADATANRVKNETDEFITLQNNAEILAEKLREIAELIKKPFEDPKFGDELIKKLDIIYNKFAALGGININVTANGAAAGSFNNGGHNTVGLIGGPDIGRDNKTINVAGGEYVIRKDAVDRYGVPFFDKLNEGFYDGGYNGDAIRGRELVESGAFDVIYKRKEIEDKIAEHQHVMNRLVELVGMEKNPERQLLMNEIYNNVWKRQGGLSQSLLNVRSEFDSLKLTGQEKDFANYLVNSGKAPLFKEILRVTKIEKEYADLTIALIKNNENLYKALNSNTLKFTEYEMEYRDKILIDNPEYEFKPDSNIQADRYIWEKEQLREKVYQNLYKNEEELANAMAILEHTANTRVKLLNLFKDEQMIEVVDIATQEPTTGTAPEQFLNRGGFVGLNGGGGVPRRGQDTIPAMLTQGEYVIPKFTVDTLGANFFEMFRNLEFVQGLSKAFRGTKRNATSYMDFFNEFEDLKAGAKSTGIIRTPGGMNAGGFVGMNAGGVAVRHFQIGGSKGTLGSIPMGDQIFAPNEVVNPPAIQEALDKIKEMEKALKRIDELDKQAIKDLQAIAEARGKDKDSLQDLTSLAAELEVKPSVLYSMLKLSQYTKDADTALKAVPDSFQRMNVIGATFENLKKSIESSDYSGIFENLSDGFGAFQTQVDNASAKVKKAIKGVADLLVPIFNSALGKVEKQFNRLFTNIIPGMLDSFLNGFVLTYAEIVQENSDAMKEIEDSFYKSRADLVEQLKRNEISYFDYFNRLEDLEHDRANDAADAAAQAEDERFDAIRDALTNITKALTQEFGVWIDGFSEFFGNVVDTFTGIGTAVAGVFDDIGGLVGGLIETGLTGAGIIAGAGGGGGLAAVLGGALGTLVAPGVGTAIGGGAGVAIGSIVGGTVGQIFESVIPIVGNIAKAFEQMVSTAIKTISQIVPYIVELGTMTEDEFIALVDSLAMMPGEIDTVVTQVVDRIPKIAEAFESALPSIVTSLTAAVRDIFGAAVGNLSSVVQTIATNFTNFIAGIDVAQLIIDFFGAVTDAIGPSSEAISTKLSETLVAAGKKLEEKAPEIITSFAAALSSSIKNLTELAIVFVQVFVDVFTDPRVVTAMVFGFIRIFRAVFDSLEDVMRELFPTLNILFTNFKLILKTVLIISTVFNAVVFGPLLILVGIILAQFIPAILLVIGVMSVIGDLYTTIQEKIEDNKKIQDSLNKLFDAFERIGAAIGKLLAVFTDGDIDFGVIDFIANLIVGILEAATIFVDVITMVADGITRVVDIITGLADDIAAFLPGADANAGTPSVGTSTTQPIVDIGGQGSGVLGFGILHEGGLFRASSYANEIAGIKPNEGFALLEDMEGVLTQKGMATLGGEAMLNAFNNGTNPFLQGTGSIESNFNVPTTGGTGYQAGGGGNYEDNTEINVTVEFNNCSFTGEDVADQVEAHLANKFDTNDGILVSRVKKMKDDNRTGIRGR